MVDSVAWLREVHEIVQQGEEGGEGGVAGGQFQLGVLRDINTFLFGKYDLCLPVLLLYLIFTYHKVHLVFLV